MSKDITGTNDAEIEVDSELTVEAFQKQLLSRYPGLSEMGDFAVALNEAYASGEQFISNHDTVAVIPPVSGG